MDSIEFTGLVLGLLLISFLFTSGLYWVVAWAFDFPFTWKQAFEVWIVMIIINGFTKKVD